MLIKRSVLDAIVTGKVSLAFRRWKRPTVRPGGTLRTAVGVLAIDSVDAMSESDVRDVDARRAGYPSRQALLEELSGREGRTYRIALRYAGEDPRKKLRERGTLDASELECVLARLARLDGASRRGPWTRAVLELIAKRPGVRAPDLAASMGRETKPFKADVRKLKELGLTESLEVGYRLSPRGKTVIRAAARRRGRSATPASRARKRK